jgi:hypothetical protein
MGDPESTRVMLLVAAGSEWLAERAGIQKANHGRGIFWTCGHEGNWRRLRYGWREIAGDFSKDRAEMGAVRQKLATADRCLRRQRTQLSKFVIGSSVQPASCLARSHPTPLAGTQGRRVTQNSAPPSSRFKRARKPCPSRGIDFGTKCPLGVRVHRKAETRDS